MKIIRRWQEKGVIDALGTHRIVFLSGPRQAGKTTLAKQIAGSRGIYLSLDDPRNQIFAKEDPEGFLRRQAVPVIIDEIQKAPWLISQIKMIVDNNWDRGQFLLTGSANITTLPTVTESLAGRIRHVRLCPFTQGEIQGRSPSFFERLETLDFPSTFPDFSRDELLNVAFVGGFP
jgi:predicted AAA+ superfamily ATPase